MLDFLIQNVQNISTYQAEVLYKKKLILIIWKLVFSDCGQTKSQAIDEDTESWFSYRD